MEEKCFCERCIKKEAVLLMMFISGGFAMSILCIAGYIMEYNANRDIASFLAMFGIVSAFAFGLSLFYAIIHNDRYRKVDLS